MTPTQIAVIAIVVIAVVAVAVVLFLRNRTTKLRDRFGPEYDRTLEEKGSRYKAEAELEKLEKRVRKYDLQPLSAMDRDRFQSSWRAIQARFVDEPDTSLTAADALIGEVMAARGYPMSDFEQRAAEVSVDHPTVVEHYRAGHQIAILHSQRKATTEDLRQAMIHYRALFDDLTQGDAPRLPMRARAAGRG
jgi:hypothetical protein